MCPVVVMCAVLCCIIGSGPSGGAGNEAMTEGGKTAVTTATVLKSNDPQEVLALRL